MFVYLIMKYLDRMAANLPTALPLVNIWLAIYKTNSSIFT